MEHCRNKQSRNAWTRRSQLKQIILDCSFCLLLFRRSSKNTQRFSYMLRKIVATSASWAPLPIRLACAAVFIAHGSQKVLGAFGGPGFKAFTAGETPFTFMQPAWVWLGAAALSELVGGILIGLGFLTRVGAFF